jgi:serine/threonine protein phosphatase PrpC
VRPVEHAQMNLGAASDVGLKRKNNEDRYAISAFRAQTGRGQPAVLAIVADGIGGHRAGEVAAEIAVETIREVVARSDGSQPLQILREAVALADQRIYQSAQQDASRQGMGSTCACALVIGDRLYTVAVGDTRIYLVSEGRIQQLTVDHTWVQEALDKGVLTEEQARDHPNSHVIRRFLGSKGGVKPDFRLKLNPGESDPQAEANQGFALRGGDTLLLCSDGLTDLVNDDEILEVVRGYRLQEAIDVLIATANQRGGHDNITIVGLGTLEAQAETRPIAVKKRWRLPVGVGCVSALAFVAVALVLAGGYYWFQSWDGPADKLTQTAMSTQGAPVFLPGVESSPPASITPLMSTPSSSSPEVFGTPATQPSGPRSSTLTPWPTNTPAP